MSLTAIIYFEASTTASFFDPVFFFEDTQRCHSDLYNLKTFSWVCLSCDMQSDIASQVKSLTINSGETFEDALIKSPERLCTSTDDAWNVKLSTLVVRSWVIVLVLRSQQ